MFVMHKSVYIMRILNFYIIITLLLCMPVSLSAQDIDKTFDSDTLMTLQYYESKVLNYSQLLKQRKEQAYAARSKEKVSRSGYLPKIDAIGQGNLDIRNLDQWNKPEGIYHPYNYFLGGTLSQPVYAGGSVSAQYNADKIQDRISVQNVLLSVDDIYLQADQAYWAASANTEYLQISQNYYEIINSQYKLIKLKFDNGAIAKNDLLMITTRLLEAELGIKKAEAAYLLSYQNFYILMGYQPDDMPVPVQPIISDMPLPKVYSFETALEQRHDYRIAELQISLARQNMKLAVSKYNPQLYFQFQGGWGTSNPNYGYPPEGVAIASLNLSFTIWDWGARCNTSRQMKALVNSQTYYKQYVADQISQDIANAYTNVTQLREQIAVAEKNLQLAKESLRLNTLSYNEGKISIADILSSQVSWIQAYSNLIQANYSYKTAVASYERALGEKSIDYEFSTK